VIPRVPTHRHRHCQQLPDDRPHPPLLRVVGQFQSSQRDQDVSQDHTGKTSPPASAGAPPQTDAPAHMLRADAAARRIVRSAPAAPAGSGPAPVTIPRGASLPPASPVSRSICCRRCSTA
jgi:hypothetical protein